MYTLSERCALSITGMFRKSFKNRIVLSATFIFVAYSVFMTIYVTVKFLTYNEIFIDDKLHINAQSLRYYIESGKKHSLAAARSMARDFEAVKAIKNRDREEILRIFSPLPEAYQINYFTITDEKGNVLVRTYEPDNFGDSIANQQNIQDAIDGKIATYCEAGTAIKVSLRTGAPVYDTDGTLVGLISAGVRLDTDEFVNMLWMYFHSDITVFFGDTRIATTITHGREQPITGTPLNERVVQIVIEGKQEYFGEANVFGVEYKVFYLPLINADDEVFAVIAVGAPLTELRAESNKLIRTIIFINFAGLACAVVVWYWVLSTISKPLIDLSRSIEEIKGGELTTTILMDGEDEISIVSLSVQKVADTIQALIDAINVTISEHDKGNTDYQLDTGKFRGAYHLLAERIVHLSKVGMHDALTGLPNRRCFDNRLEVEWNHAIREKVPLSILMIDIDHFKKYNDVCGHQQGDLVLQKVAHTLALIIKRTVDFVARWGGEEFVVLLPQTNAQGAMRVAEKIRETIEKMEIPCMHGRTTDRVTVSIGVSTYVFSQGDSIANLIARADEAMYKAKAAGRNRVRVQPKATG